MRMLSRKARLVTVTLLVASACDCGVHGVRSVGPLLQVCVVDDHGTVDPAKCGDTSEAPSAMPVLDFGPVAQGESKVGWLRLANIGGSPLEVSKTNLVAGSSAEFAVPSAPWHGTVLADGHVTMEVDLDATTPGELAGALAVTSNDEHVSPLAIRFVARVEGGTDSGGTDGGTDGGTTETGPCGGGCDQGLTCCGDECVDIQNDPQHCGGCNGCPGGERCIAGACRLPSNGGCDDLTAPCGGALKCCNHQCVDVSGSGGSCPCTGDGSSSLFAAGSIIIPMDVCWQRGLDVTQTPSYCTNNAKTVGDDAPLKAYGLVFFLLRHQVTVNMAINPQKTAIDGVDMTLASTDGKAPVQRYDWATGRAVDLPNDHQTAVDYRGGPFLIDASQHDRVLQLLASDPDFAQFRSAKNITVHIARTPFASTIAKSLSVVPSRIALLTPADESAGSFGGLGGGGSNYEILTRYLKSAGLDFPGAGGTPDHPGQIYDQLQESDFLPNYAQSNLKRGGYKLLWSPHWEGLGSDGWGDLSPNLDAQLATIGDYVAAGGDLFAECAAIGTLEGGFGGVYPGSAQSRFMTTGGFTGNYLTGNDPNGDFTGPFAFTGITSPLAQRGDFPFAAFFGAISDFTPARGSSYLPQVTRYVSASANGHATDVFASIAGRAQGSGMVVYLGGHDYSYGGMEDDSYSGHTPGLTAGSRLVLNTLFQLGQNDTCH